MPERDDRKTAAEWYAAAEARRRANDAAVHRARVRDAAWRTANV